MAHAIMGPGIRIRSDVASRRLLFGLVPSVRCDFFQGDGNAILEQSRLGFATSNAVF